MMDKKSFIVRNSSVIYAAISINIYYTTHLIFVKIQQSSFYVNQETMDEKLKQLLVAENEGVGK